MNLTQKETSLLKDLKAHEQLCIEKYNKYSAEACNPQLKTIFSELAQVEQEHFQTISQIENGTVPQMGQGSGKQKTMPTAQNNYLEQDKQKDSILCQDMLSTEKHVSSMYNTSIFEFKDVGIRDALNHIQKEEQEHGEKIFCFMNQNGMYN
jgi:spore coat protein CotF